MRERVIGIVTIRQPGEIADLEPRKAGLDIDGQAGASGNAQAGIQRIHAGRAGAKI